MPEAVLTAEQAAEWGKTLDFPAVWAAIMKMSAKVDKMAERVDQTSRDVGRILNDQGKLFEEMFSANVWDKFRAYGYDFTKGSRMRFKEAGQVLAEVDILLENGEYVMAVEVKSTLTNDWIDEHLDRIRKVRSYMDARADRRTLVGAVAGGIVPESARRYAEKRGLYVLAQNGENVSVAEDPATFRAAEWKTGEAPSA